MTPACQSYWSKLTDKELIDGYLNPHAAKAEDEGLYVRALALREAVRRLETADDAR